ncbi:MAG TPA: glycoside hydrolase family 38 C-terminal domain-containing protein [Draconibacterium sp.]|nr:glycoside hydrolase family 38 C-terminal domain-containing protein [Draconibacterium sp.]
MKLKITTIAMILFFTGLTVNAQDDDQKPVFDLAGKSANWVEGFQKNTGGNEFEYSSFRSDVSKSLLTRCTDGKMAIEWETAKLPANLSQNETGFLWIAAFDLTSDLFVFDLYLNGEKRFEIPTTTKKNWEIETVDGGKLSFVTVETDSNGDAHGYMYLIAPKSWLKPGESQTIKINGHAAGSNTWLIVYQATDALSFLQNSVEQDILMNLTFEETPRNLKATIVTLPYFTGKELTCISGNSTQKILLTQKNGMASGEFVLPLSAKNKPFYLNDSKGEVFVVKSLGEPFQTTRLLANSVLFNESKIVEGKAELTAKRNYKPKTVSSLLKLSESNLAKGKIYLMNSSHQDIAWMDSPEKCVVERDTMLFSPLFELAQKDENYRFDVEDALMIKEFIERHPDKKELVKQMLQDGRISCGSTYIQPYEEMYSGESLARQFYFGAKWLKDEFGYTASVYWNEDVPGRTLQMMQMMSKAGTKYLMMSRHERGLYRWSSPDGSSVVAFTPGHYGNAFQPLQKNFHEAAQFLATSSADWEKYYSPETKSPVIPLLSDWDMSPAKDYSNLINQWEKIDELQNSNREYVPVKLPGFKIASTPEFFESLVAENPNLIDIKGERPAVWLYIHGPSHQKAIKTSREGDILLTQAEKFATANALVKGSFINYPETELRNAWEAKIYPDHGWGGKHGDITDAYFQSKYEFAKAEAEKILDKNLNELASSIKTDAKKGRPLVVFNSMNTERTDPVSVEVNFEKSQTFSIEVCDQNGRKLDVQLTNVEKYKDRSIKKANLNFLAENIPSIGYKTYYLNGQKNTNQELNKTFQNDTENRFYRLKFGNGGLTSIFDKELQQELINSEKFAAGEVFTMRSEGNGAGEFADIQQPNMEGFDKTGNYETKWEVDETGPVFTVFKYRQKIRNAVVEQRIKLWHNKKQIDFETALLNWEGVLYREFRMALPLNMTDGQVAYEVPFGVVEVGKDEMEGAAGERYKTPCKDFHPRGIENWISSSNSEFGVTMSSTVAVADWVDPTDNPVPNQVLQPILLASRRSCHWEGNEYLQTGDHHFKFSITSHKPGWENGTDFGRQANETLKTAWAENSYTTATLPESMSFYKTDQPLVFISTVKKAEDSNDIIVRITDLEGKDKTVTLESFKKTSGASLTNLIEEGDNALKINQQGIQLNLGHHAIETVKIKF